jgi:hypothetical protein
MIERAHTLGLRVQAGNANAMLMNARAFVVEDASVQGAFEEAKLRIDAVSDARDLDEARRAALQAIGSLELSLAHARPNEHASAIGVDWF